MTQPVTALGSVELASKLEELSGLASQVVRYSDELQTVSQSDFSGISASACALLPVAFSSAQNCLSVLQFILGQTPISLPPSSPLVVGPPPHSPVPSPIPTESDRSVSPTEPCRGECGAIESRADSLVVDPRFLTPRLSPLAICAPNLPANSLDLTLPSRPTTPATQRWPIPPPPIRTDFAPFIYQTPGGRSDDERSPSSPLLSSTTPIRHGVSIAELVDEENSSPGTRGGISSSRSPATRVNTSSVHSRPPLFISIADVTPRSVGRQIPGVSQTKPLRSSPPSPSETPKPFTPWALGPSQSPSMYPASNDHRHTASEGEDIPRHSKRGKVSLTTPEVPERRVTRSSAKRKAAEDSEMGAKPPKRVKIGSP